MHPERKSIRLPSHDYNMPGYYFVTICTKDKLPVLCRIVGTGVPDGPRIEYKRAGIISCKQLETMSCFYEQIQIEKYIIMPNHIHLLLHVPPGTDSSSSVQSTGAHHSRTVREAGPYGNDSLIQVSGTNNLISKFIGTFKRFTNKEAGAKLWQARSYDHIVRDEQDFQRIWKYIDSNPTRWMEDSLYCGDEVTV